MEHYLDAEVAAQTQESQESQEARVRLYIKDASVAGCLRFTRAWVRRSGRFWLTIRRSPELW